MRNAIPQMGRKQNTERECVCVCVCLCLCEADARNRNLVDAIRMAAFDLC